MLNVIDVSAAPYNASCNLTADDTAAVQNAINALPNGGKLIVPGKCKISTPLSVSTSLTIEGLGMGFSGLYAAGDNGLLSFANNCDNANLNDIGIYGKQDPSARQHNIYVGDNACVHLTRVRSWGGYSALFMRGNDGHMMDCFLMSAAPDGACVISNGANWWTRCKIDPGVWPVQWAFLQGSSVLPGTTENRFTQCDLSGTEQYAIMIDDGGTHQANFAFSKCIFSGPVAVNNAIWAGFNLCTFGGAISAGANVLMTMGDCWALSPTVVSGGLKHFSNNINIS